MKNMFITALEESFDELFKKKNPLVNLNDPHTSATYREELQRFAKFLVEEYNQSTQDDDFWEERAFRQ